MDIDSIAVITFILLVYMGVLTAVHYFIPTTQVKDREYNIYTINDSHVDGSPFYLGMGSFHDELYYLYMLNTEKGQMMEKVLVNHTNVKRVRGLTEPKLEIYTQEYPNDFLALLFETKGGKEYEYILNVPEDAVITNFNMEME